MSITFTKAYVANGKTFATLREAQIEGITGIMSEKGVDLKFATTCAELIVGSGDMAVSILTTKESSRPKARKVNGGRKPRKTTTAELPLTHAA